jgi:hypothetical protein
MDNYPPTVKGYTYAAEIWCPPCLMERLSREGQASPAAAGMSPEDALDHVAQARGIDRTREWLFDSDDFPKAITSASVHANCTYSGGCLHRCGQCGQSLGEVICFPAAA